MSTKPDRKILDTMAGNPRNWKGPFYVNRKDARLLVPKLYPSMGWTLNFGSPYAYLFLAAIIVIIIISLLVH